MGITSICYLLYSNVTKLTVDSYLEYKTVKDLKKKGFFQHNF